MKRTFCLFLVPYVCATGLFAQAGAGSGAVSGTVKEATGDGIPDTVIELTNPALGVKRVMATTDDGLFTAPALTPAAGYRLKMSHKNFADWQSAEFEVSVGQTVNFQVTLKHTADSAKYDEGSIPAPEVREWKAGTANQITPIQIATLPSNRRRLDPFVALGPLVSRPNAFLTDGILTTNSYFGQRPGVAPQLPLDSVHDAQVLAGNYAPEFGGVNGSIVNAATRSGGEMLHGTAYAFLNDGSWNAARIDKQRQFGAALGGAILPGKLFYFANGDVWEGRGTGVNRIITPFLGDPCRATAVQCAAASSFLQKQMNVPVALSARNTAGLARLDYRRSDRNQFTLSANAMDGRSPNGPLDQTAPDGGLLGLPDSTEQVRYGKLGWIGAPTDNSVNELRVGVFRDRISNPSAQPGGVGIVLAGATVGNPRPNASSFNEKRSELVENFTASSNSHTFRIGADVWKTSDAIDSLNAAGTYYFNSLTTFAQGNYSLFTQEYGTAARTLYGRQYNTYAMDTWRPVRRLTIVAGVRWEKQRRPQPSAANPAYYATGKIAAPVIDFAPRISAALQLDPTTVFRFGYFWSYQPLPGQAQDALFLGNGLYQTSVSVNPNQNLAPVYPNVLTFPAIPSGSTNLIYGSSKLRDPRLEQYTAALEKTLGKSTTLAITGVRERGFGLWTMSDVNLAAPTVTKTYAIDDATGKQISTYATSIWTARQDARFAHVYSVANGGSYWHSALGVELRHRMAHGLSAQASYTWSQALDNVGGPTLAGSFPLSLNGDGIAPRALSAIDQRQRFVLNWTWQGTVTHSTSAVVRHALNGWALSGIGSVASGLPVTPVAIVAGQQFSGTAMTYTTTLNGAGGWARVPFTGVDSLNTGRQYNLDARLSRTLDFTERVKAVLLFEAFNALNSSYNLAISSVAYQAIPTTPPAGTVNGPYTGVIHPVAGLGAGTVTNQARTAQVGFRLTF